MINNKRISIATGGSRKATHWPCSTLMWSEFVSRLKTPVRSTETLQEYMALSKGKQDDLKDVGGFVGGTLNPPRRKSANVVGRDLVTLDMDNIATGGTEDVLKRVSSLGCAAAVYSTRKHSDYAPRLRVIIPLHRTVTADEYEPIARKLAELIGLSFCDPTTFEAVRLMYWPSASSDSAYVCEVYDRAFCDPDGVLGLYTDWTDVTTWPQVPGADAIEKRRLAKQENPLTKQGLVGTFCRTYSITAAMEHFLPGMYEPTTESGRYTFTGGTTAGGAVVYDGDIFLYSHHATDPCSGQLVNAWDLVRLHMYGDRDNEAKDGTPAAKMPSYLAMRKLAVDDPAVSDLMNRERIQRARDAFSVEDVASGAENTPALQEVTENDTEWLSRLKLDGNGNFAKVTNNVVLIMEHDPALKGKIAIDEFGSCGLSLGPLPWNSYDGKRQWDDNDDANVHSYIETFYGISSRTQMDEALTIVSNRHVINEVKDYLLGLTWDGVPRLDTLLPDYLGAEDNAYSRAVMRKSLVAACGRAIDGSTKYDQMPILTGAQGIGKSTFLANLGKDWFSDSLTTFEGKDAAELIQGRWIIEVGELTAMSRQEVNAVKQFLSKRDDIYRAAYGRRTKKYPRRCVFFGTTNAEEFLKDTTGNRRFWPVEVGEQEPKYSVWTDMPKIVDQIWAEAMHYYRIGEPLYMPKELEKMAIAAQEQHQEDFLKKGQIIEFLEMKVPENWLKMPLMVRRQFLANPTVPEDTKLVRRDRICAQEIWEECFNGDLKYMKRSDAVELNSILKSIGWIREKRAVRRGDYGPQKCHIRPDYRV